MKRVLAISRGLVGLGAALAAVPACAQTIYPLNRAEILAGARFDLKVEFPGAPAQGAVSVKINGEDAAAVAGKSAAFVEKEDGGEYSAYWIRGVTLPKPGK
ncbi:MAG: alkaline phosphatase, partial [Hyphomicrobium sp.]